MIDHFEFRIGKIKESAAFYKTVLKPLGIKQAWKSKSEAGFCHVDSPGVILMLISEAPKDSKPSKIHLAFAASSFAQVDAFHAAAMAAGYESIGAPGPRPDYCGKDETYYAAFVADPDGHNIEAVCRLPAP